MKLPQFLKHGFWQNIISTKRKSAFPWGKYVRYGIKGPRDWVAGDMSHIHEDQEFVFRDIKNWREVCMYVCMYTWHNICKIVKNWIPANTGMVLPKHHNDAAKLLLYVQLPVRGKTAVRKNYPSTATISLDG
jgi:hypothetical protein